MISQTHCSSNNDPMYNKKWQNPSLWPKRGTMKVDIKRTATNLLQQWLCFYCFVVLGWSWNGIHFVPAHQINPVALHGLVAPCRRITWGFMAANKMYKQILNDEREIEELNWSHERAILTSGFRNATSHLISFFLNESVSWLASYLKLDTEFFIG